MKALPLLLSIASLTLGTATQHGTEPGKVVFDGQHKGFSCLVGEDSGGIQLRRTEAGTWWR